MSLVDIVLVTFNGVMYFIIIFSIKATSCYAALMLWQIVYRSSNLNCFQFQQPIHHHAQHSIIHNRVDIAHPNINLIHKILNMIVVGTWGRP
jgi:hypothetical protein